MPRLNGKNTKWVYIFTERIRNMRITRELSIDCNKCGKKIEIKDKVFSRNSHGRKSKSKVYHIGCARMVNIL